MEFDVYSSHVYNDAADLDDEDFCEILDNPEMVSEQNNEVAG